MISMLLLVDNALVKRNEKDVSSSTNDTVVITKVKRVSY